VEICIPVAIASFAVQFIPYASGFLGFLIKINHPIKSK